MPLEASCPAPGEVRAWYAQVETAFADPAAIARAVDELAPLDRERYERYRGDIDRQMFLLGRTMARAVVGRAAGVEPAEWQWREGEHGRPEIAHPSTGLRFNLAHSAGLVVCALANGRAVGVDVEDLARHPTNPGLVRRYCAPDEIADIEAQGADWRARFLKYWTLKEAYLKARGLGISVPLSDISFSLQPDRIRVAFLRSLAGADANWTFHLARPTDRHLVAIAASGDGLVFHRFQQFGDR